MHEDGNKKHYQHTGNERTHPINDEFAVNRGAQREPLTEQMPDAKQRARSAAIRHPISEQPSAPGGFLRAMKHSKFRIELPYPAIPADASYEVYAVSRDDNDVTILSADRTELVRLTERGELLVNISQARVGVNLDQHDKTDGIDPAVSAQLNVMISLGMSTDDILKRLSTDPDAVA